MTLGEWMSLKAGDVVIERKSGLERPVVDVKMHITDRNHIRIWMYLHKGQFSTRGNLACYTIHHDKGRWSLKR